MRVNPQYFEDGVLRIKCVASISPSIWSGNKEAVIQQQGLQQFEIPLPSIDTREVLFLGEKLNIFDSLVSRHPLEMKIFLLMVMIDDDQPKSISSIEFPFSLLLQ
jgi:hypothetical protein